MEFGAAAFSSLVILDEQQQAWGMAPNRKFMPSRRTVTDPDRRIAMQFDQKILGKLTNPLYRVALALLDGEGNELYRLADPRTNVADCLLGLGPNEWVVFQAERPVAKVAQLPRRKQTATGFFGALQSWLAGSDQGVVSFGPQHLFPAPVALSLLMIFNEVVVV